MLYDGKPSNEQDNAVIFSITNKMLVHLKQPKVINEYRTFYWNVSKVRNGCSCRCNSHLKWYPLPKTDIFIEMQILLRRNQRDHKKPKLSDALSSSDGLSLDYQRETGIKSPATFCVLRDARGLRFLICKFDLKII